MRTTLEVRDEVLSRGGRYQVVHAKGVSSKDPSPLKVKEVDVGGHRYIVCLNDDQAKKDAANRDATPLGKHPDMQESSIEQFL